MDGQVIFKTLWDFYIGIISSITQLWSFVTNEFEVFGIDITILGIGSVTIIAIVIFGILT